MDVPPRVEQPGADLARFLEEDDGAPVVVFNLLRYAPGRRALYEEYAARIQPLLADYGCETVYAGDCSATLVGPSAFPWDSVVLVRYPSRTAFGALVAEPAYAAIADLRTRGLAETVLQATIEWPQARPGGDAQPGYWPQRGAPAGLPRGGTALVGLVRVAPGASTSAGSRERLTTLLTDLDAQPVYGGVFSTPLAPATGSGWDGVVVAHRHDADGLDSRGVTDALGSDRVEGIVVQATRDWPPRS